MVTSLTPLRPVSSGFGPRQPRPLPSHQLFTLSQTLLFPRKASTHSIRLATCSTIGSKREPARKLKRPCRQLVCDACQRLTEAGAWSRPIAVRATVPNEVWVIEHVECFCPQVEREAFWAEGKYLFEERRHVVRCPAAPRVPSRHRSIDDRAIRRSTVISAIGGSGHNVVRQSRPKTRHSTKVDSER